mmetsp:Transcript_22289/g.49318  ORF Transcript_22289/g.49318 Transcript_22289/m.49318 type:complete len:233 (-) Transcript_22289:25-723(-)
MKRSLMLPSRRTGTEEEFIAAHTGESSKSRLCTLMTPASFCGAKRSICRAMAPPMECPAKKTWSTPNSASKSPRRGSMTSWYENSKLSVGSCILERMGLATGGSDQQRRPRVQMPNGAFGNSTMTPADRNSEMMRPPSTFSTNSRNSSAHSGGPMACSRSKAARGGDFHGGPLATAAIAAALSPRSEGVVAKDRFHKEHTATIRKKMPAPLESEVVARCMATSTAAEGFSDR